MIPSMSSATISARSPRAAAAATRRQKAEAFSMLNGLMKLTDAPPSTQSINSSASAWISSSVTIVSRLTLKLMSGADIVLPAQSLT